MRKHKKIICVLLTLALIFSMLLPVFAKTETTREEDSSYSESYDENTNTTTKTVTKTVTIQTVTVDDANNNKTKPEGEPTLEPSRYASYKDFDDLLKKERGSRYKYNEQHEVYFTISENTTEMRISIHHSSGEDTSEEYAVYDDNGNLIEAEVEYLPNEMVIILRNVHKGQKFRVVTKNNGFDGIYVTQISSGEYLYDEFWSDSSIPAFDAFGYYNYSSECFRTLNRKDNITVTDLKRLLQTYPLIPSDSLLKRDGVAEAFLSIQNEYNVSALGLLAIACLESAYGTSNIANKKLNLFGWGAVDNNPFNGAWDWSDMDVSDAIYKALKLIVVNYPQGSRGQDSYYTMRYNNGVHQYCTSTTWVASNSRIRAQLETFLGLR